MGTPQGFLITFEGLGGSGKSTVVRSIYAWLQQQGEDVILTREPGGTPLGTHLRNTVLGMAPMTHWTEAFLFEADRAQTYAEVILPAINEGRVVVSDRNLYGTIAYQGFGRNLDLDLIDAMSKVATVGQAPHLAIVLDVDPAVGLRRKQKQGEEDRFDRESLEYQARVREGYLFAAARDQPRSRVIDANQPLNQATDQIKVEITAALIAHRQQ